MVQSKCQCGKILSRISSCFVYNTEFNKVYIKNKIPDNQFFNLQNIGNSVDGKSHYTHAATLSGKGVWTAAKN